MASENPTFTERQRLCELLTTLGPDAPTLCGDWTTRYLTAHLLLRERRPVAAIGIAFGPLSGRTARVQRELAAGPFPALVERLRTRPWWTRAAPVDRAVNTLELFVHHEDVRRAQPDWQPREMAELGPALWRRVTAATRLRLRRFRATVVVEAPGHGVVRTGRGGPEARLTADPGELLLFLTGRQRVARVELSGSPELTARLAAARLGI